MEAADAATSLETKIKAGWLALHATVPVYFPNDPLPTYEDAPKFVHVEIRTAVPPRPMGYGGLAKTRYRQTGEMIVRIFVDALSGRDTIRGYADDVVKVMRGYRDGDLQVTGVGPAGGEASQLDGNWYQLDVLASFWFDTFG